MIWVCTLMWKRVINTVVQFITKNQSKNMLVNSYQFFLLGNWIQNNQNFQLFSTAAINPRWSNGSCWHDLSILIICLEQTSTPRFDSFGLQTLSSRLDCCLFATIVYASSISSCNLRDCSFFFEKTWRWITGDSFCVSFGWIYFGMMYYSSLLW